MTRRTILICAILATCILCFNSWLHTLPVPPQVTYKKKWKQYYDSAISAGNRVHVCANEGNKVKFEYWYGQFWKYNDSCTKYYDLLFQKNADSLEVEEALNIY